MVFFFRYIISYKFFKMLTKFFVLIISLINVCHGRNIVLIMADDLDSVLDGMTPLDATQKFIGNEGCTYKNAFAAVPICCPNRASILTGRYQHNHQVYNNSLSGGCNSNDWQKNFETNTFASILKKKANYRTFYAGKYLNEYGNKNAGGVGYVPPGWDEWYGLVGNSKYYNYSLSVNGKEKVYRDSQSEYLTDVIRDLALTFINDQKKETPFLMVLSPPAPHQPWVPATRHTSFYKDVKAKRTKSFNLSNAQEKHWLLRMGMSPLPSDVVQKLDFIYRRRWETLLAVDELVEKVYAQLKNKGLLEETYIIFTSDNGYHVGQFSMPYDKRQPYETDIKVPLLIRGPGVTRGTEVKTAVSSVDLFATMMEIAGVDAPSDGLSLLAAKEVVDRTVLVEYHGERSIRKPSSGCPSDDDTNLSHCDRAYACKCMDAANNTFTCVRRVAHSYNSNFCLFAEDEEYAEYYDLTKDEDQLDNLAPDMGGGTRYRFRKRVKKMSICKGKSCIATNPPYKKKNH